MPLTILPPEKQILTDRITGARVHQLTNYLAHSYHLYFTSPGWWDGNRRLIFGSDRDNRSNLYSIELESGEITRLTDDAPGETVDYQGAGLNPTRDEAYFWRKRRLIAIDLRSGEQRMLFECPEGWNAHGVSCTSDGRFICAGMGQPVDVGPVDLGAGYLGFREIFEAHPLSRVVMIPTDGENNSAQVLHEERNWVGHVNASPTQPHLLTFCHEGPWHLVEQRMWVLDQKRGTVEKLRPQEPDEAVGHEYWMQDGETIGYHGKQGENAFYGTVRYDNSGRHELPFPLDSNHFHSNTPILIVADGPQRGLTPHVLLCRLHEGEFQGPRVLCLHRGSRHIQHLHVHPTFTPDEKHVLFTADPRGYGQLFLAEVPPFESLPTLEEISHTKTVV